MMIKKLEHNLEKVNGLLKEILSDDGVDVRFGYDHLMTVDGQATGFLTANEGVVRFCIRNNKGEITSGALKARILNERIRH